MNTRLVHLSSLLCAVIALHFPLAGASEPGPAMPVAIAQLVAAQDLDTLLPAMLGSARTNGIEEVKRAAYGAIAANPAWSDVERTRAKALMDELVPEMTSAVDAQYRALDARALVTDMMGTVYPKHYSADEISQLAAYFASSSYKKVAGILLIVEQEGARTGQNKGALFGKLAAERLTPEDNRQLGEFHGTTLGRKKRALDAQVGKESAAYLQSRVSPVIAAALAPYQESFAKKMAAAQR